MMNEEPSEEQLRLWNEELAGQPASAVIRWGLERAGGRAVVSTNFRPYEAVLLHLVTQADPGIPVLWVDHGYNRPATYLHAEALRRRLGLAVRAYVPRMTAAHREATEGPIPSPEQEEALQRFSAVFKLEPFQRGMRELAPRVWFTALRKVQNPNRAGMEVVGYDRNFGVLKLSPLLEWTDAQMQAYLDAEGLPNEWDYFDPAKADEKRECGLHSAWGAKAMKG